MPPAATKPGTWVFFSIKPMTRLIEKADTAYRIDTARYISTGCPVSSPDCRAKKVNSLMDTAKATEEFDEYELFYVHQSYCDHSELNRVLKDILINFLDPKTYLIAAQVKLQPLNLPDFLEKHGTFGTPFTPGGDYEIDYWYQAGQYENWDLERRPLTSTPVPYNP